MQSNFSLFQKSLLFKLANILEEEIDYPVSHLSGGDPYGNLTQEKMKDLVDQSNIRRWGGKSETELYRLIELGWKKEIDFWKKNWSAASRETRDKIEMAAFQAQYGKKPNIKLEFNGREWNLSINDEKIATGLSKRQTLLQAVAAFWA